MTIEEIKSEISKDNNLPDHVRNMVKSDLNRWLSAIVELYLLSPNMEFYSVGLGGYKPLCESEFAINEYISITNIFRLHTILGIKLFSQKSGEHYVIYCNALGFKFQETISVEMYNQVYKPLTTTISEYDIFHPYSH